MKIVFCICIIILMNCTVIKPALNLNLCYENAVPGHPGQASYYTLFYIFSWGDGSISAGMNNGGLWRIHHVDLKIDDYLIFQKTTYIVYGDGNSPAMHNLPEAWKIISINNKYGMYDPGTKQTTIEAKFDDLKEFNEDFAAAKNFGKWGYINRQGKVVIEYQFDNAGPFTNGQASVEFNGKFGYVDKSGVIHQ